LDIQSMKLAYFSPTGTTRSIVQAIAYGIDINAAEQIDVTRPDMRKKQLQTSKNDLLVVAVPVYIGRVPALLTEWLHGIKADRTPAVCIVVYGNRDYDDALLELRNILMERGCIPIACAAYIGEHSYSSTETPIAVGRPDINDLKHAELFGRKINEKLRTLSAVDYISDVKIPGSYPYRGDNKLWCVDFIEVSDECIQCGTCAELCPVGAIDSEESNLIDKGKCITCCACIKNCPQNARTMKPGSVKDAAVRLHNLYKERKEPVFYI
jgi:ferredoxin/menaquinone-dependent protoporphyrinogen IX oxidase